MGGGSDSCFLPLLTQPSEVTEGTGLKGECVEPEYLGPARGPEVNAGTWGWGGIPERAKAGEEPEG